MAFQLSLVMPRAWACREPEHAESLNIEFENELTADDARALFPSGVFVSSGACLCRAVLGCVERYLFVSSGVCMCVRRLRIQ